MDIVKTNFIRQLKKQKDLSSYKLKLSLKMHMEMSSVFPVYNFYSSTRKRSKDITEVA